MLKDDVSIHPIHLRRDHRIQVLVLLTMTALGVQRAGVAFAPAHPRAQTPLDGASGTGSVRELAGGANALCRWQSVVASTATDREPGAAVGGA